MKRIGWAVVAVFFVAACSGGGDDVGDDDDDDGATGCPRAFAAENRTRYGAIGLPYTAASEQANTWEIVALSATGGVSFGGASFEMGRQPLGEVVFTPDGQVGLVAHDDGTIGVFTVSSNGVPTVVHAAWTGEEVYATKIVMDPTGERAWVLDLNFPKNGGGIFSVKIGCPGSLEGNGALTDERRHFTSKLAYDMELRTPGFAVVYAKNLDDSAVGHDVHKLQLDPLDALSGVDAFPTDDDAIVSDIAVTDDDNFVLIADNNAFGTGNRVSVVDLVPMNPVLVQTLLIDDPISIAVSPFGDAAMVASGFGDAVFSMEYDVLASPPFANPVELLYVGAPPQLPANFVTIVRGTLEGNVYLAELSGIRRLRFEGGGQVEDLGVASRGGGVENLVGAFGFPQ